MRVGNGIDLVSLLNRTAPNSFFEKFEVKEKKDYYNISVYVSTLDVLNKKTNKFIWADDPVSSAYHLVNVWCTTDETYFNFINNENYKEKLKKGKVFDLRSTTVLDYLGLNVLRNPILETDNEIVYNLFYNFNFNVPRDTGFIGFFTNVNCDYLEYQKSKKLIGMFDFSFLNDSFSLEKFALVKNNVINNTISRPYTKQDLLWCGEYKHLVDEKIKSIFPPTTIPNRVNYNGIDVYYVNGIKYPLTFKQLTLPVLVYKTFSSIRNLDTIPIKQENYDNLNSIDSLVSKEVYTSLDHDLGMDIKFSMDVSGLILKNSLYPKIIGSSYLEEKEIFLESLSACHCFEAELIRTNVLTGEECNIRNVTWDDINNNIWLGYKNSNLRFNNLNIIMFSFYDPTINMNEFGDYNYTLKAKVKDGFVTTINKRITDLINFQKFFKDYQADSEIASKKVNDYNYKIYYNELIDSFTPLYVAEQNLKDSYWMKTIGIVDAYAKLYNIFADKEMSDAEKRDIYNNINPETASVSSIQFFSESIDKILSITLEFIKDSKPWYMHSETVLKNVKPTTNKWFVDFTYNVELDNSLNSIWGIQQISQILKITNNSGYISSIVPIYLSRDEKFLLKDNFYSPTSVDDLYEIFKKDFEFSVDFPMVYEMFAKYYYYMQKLTEKPISSIFSETINRCSIEELSSLYKYYTGRNPMWEKRQYNGGDDWGGYSFSDIKREDFLDDGVLSITKYINSVAGYFNKLEQISQMNPSLENDYRKFFYIYFRFLLGAQVEYFAGYLGSIKRPVWQAVDYSNLYQIVDTIINDPSKPYLLIRYRFIDYSNLGFFNIDNLNLDILNQYYVFKPNSRDKKNWIPPPELVYSPPGASYEQQYAETTIVDGPIAVAEAEEYVAVGNTVHTYSEGTDQGNNSFAYLWTDWGNNYHNKKGIASGAAAAADATLAGTGYGTHSNGLEGAGSTYGPDPELPDPLYSGPDGAVAWRDATYAQWYFPDGAAPRTNRYALDMESPNMPPADNKTFIPTFHGIDVNISLKYMTGIYKKSDDKFYQENPITLDYLRDF